MESSRIADGTTEQRALPGFVEFLHRSRASVMDSNKQHFKERMLQDPIEESTDPEDPIEESTDKDEPKEDGMSTSSRDEDRCDDSNSRVASQEPDNSNDAKALSQTATWPALKTQYEGGSDESRDYRDEKEKQINTSLLRNDDAMITFEPLPCGKYDSDGKDSEEASNSNNATLMSPACQTTPHNIENNREDQEAEREVGSIEPAYARKQDGPGSAQTTIPGCRVSNCRRVQRRCEHRQPNQLSLEEAFKKSEKSMPFARNELIVVDSDDN